jgi:hypothetical protein
MQAATAFGFTRGQSSLDHDFGSVMSTAVNRAHRAHYRELDITGVTWAQASGYADLVGEIKPMKGLPSPVFTSKFCHFLLPKVFPVVDSEGSGNRWPRYQQYFNQVQSL